MIKKTSSLAEAARFGLTNQFYAKRLVVNELGKPKNQKLNPTNSNRFVRVFGFRFHFRFFGFVFQIPTIGSFEQ